MSVDEYDTPPPPFAPDRHWGDLGRRGEQIANITALVMISKQLDYLIRSLNDG